MNPLKPGDTRSNGAPGDDAARFRALVEYSLEVIVVLDPDGTLRYVSPSVEAVLGYRADALVGGRVFDLMHPDDRGRGEAEFARVVQTPGVARASEFRCKHYDGSWRTLEALARNLLDDPALRGIVVSGRDVSDHKRAQQALQEQALRDGLTGLYNRNYFNHRLAEEISRADRCSQLLAVLVCDLDQFKSVNDRLGHQAGDEALRAAAKSIAESTRGTDLVFRWGADEFVVVLTNTTRDGVVAVADRIRGGIHRMSQRSHLEIDVSVGAALYPEHGADADELMRIADRALYLAKRGQQKVHIGDDNYRLDERTIKVVFQPIIDIRGDRMIGYEALGRDAQGQLNILELFKKYQAVGQLSELKRLCFMTQLRLAQSLGLERVFINIDFNLLSHFASVSKRPEIDVILEISEGEALHDIDANLRIVEKLRGQGFKFALDDFGAGFISLPFITRLMPEYIKLDRATVLQAIASTSFRAFLKEIVTSLRRFSKDGIIAEGIERREELDAVHEIGIEYVQGFLFGRPQELPAPGSGTSGPAPNSEPRPAEK